MLLIPFRYTMGDSSFTSTTVAAFESVDGLIMLVYTVDVVLGFRKAYLNRNCMEEKDPVLIAKRYLKFYFWIDLLAAIPYQAFSSKPGLRFFALLKISRLIRINKILLVMRIDAKSRTKLKVVYLVLSTVILIHWITCYLLVHFKNHWVRVHPMRQAGSTYEDLKAIAAPWDHDYWIPPVDVARAKSGFYQLSPDLMYTQVFYYVVLLILGNDVNPQNHEQFVIFTLVILLGALWESYIMGEISAQMMHVHDDGRVAQQEYIYVSYSGFCCRLGHQKLVKLYQYIYHKSHVAPMTTNFAVFLNFLNPSLNYHIRRHCFLGTF